MSRNLDPKTFVETAIEATYYLSPTEPGLSQGDLIEVGALLGLRPGELGDAIQEALTLGHIGRTGQLYILAVNYMFATVGITWEGSPRSRGLHEAIVEVLVGHIKEHGKSNRRVELDHILEALAEEGYSGQEIAAELAMMELGRILKRDSDAVLVSRPAADGFRHRNSMQSSPEEMSFPRPHFRAIFDAVQAHLEGRSSSSKTNSMTNKAPRPHMTTPTQNHSPMSDRRMNGVFISHSSADEEMVGDFVRGVLESGVGVPGDDVFCISTDGQGIPAGQYFIPYIRSRVQESKVVVAWISRNFLESPFCMCELGAAWALLPDGLIPILVDLEYTELEAILKGMHVLRANDKPDLNRLRDQLTKELSLKPRATGRWEKERDTFWHKYGSPNLLVGLPRV